MMKKSIFVLLLFSSVFIFGSISEWNSLQINILMTKDPYSYLTYSGTQIESDQFKTIASIDYFNYGINALAMFDNYWGRIGVFIERSSNDTRDTMIKEVSGRDIVPTIIGISVGKKIKNFGLGLTAFGYRMDEYLNDQASPYNNTTFSFSDFNLNPGITVNINEMLSFDIAGNISILSISADDVNRVLRVNSSIGYKLNGKITQNFSENKIVLSANYSQKPYGYEELQQEDASGDIYLNTVDTLAVRVLFGVESFSYVNTYISADYEQSMKSYKLIFMTGSESEERITKTKFPGIATGFSFYLNKFISLNIGASGCWYNLKDERAPLLSPTLQTSGFEYDFRTGILLAFDNLLIAFDMSKEIANIPYIFSGGAINGLDMNIGISYTGYEF